MANRVIGRRTYAILATVVSGTFAACESPADVHEHPQPDVIALARVGTGGLDGLARTVRQATARYHSTVQAATAGYAEASPCVASPAGGMGFHWVNDALVDPVFDPLQPEALLYEPGPNGKLHLVAVEYIVIDVGQPAPVFAGTPFDVGGTPVPVAHWSLHTWVHKENPNGLHSPFNPAVVCP